MAKSALIGMPPATEQDYWVATYMIHSLGLKTNPSDGFTCNPPRPPPGESQFETRGPGIIAGLSICIFVMAGITGFRLYLRILTPRLKAGLDDMLIVPGVILAIAYPVLQMVMVSQGGAGKHLYDCTYREFYLFKWLSATAQVVFFVSIGIIKMSITAFNMRLTGLSSRPWMVAHWSFFALLVCYTVVAFALTVFPCTPIWSSFDVAEAGKLPQTPKCMSVRQIGTILRAINITMDYCLLAVPIVVLWTVQMDIYRKVKLFALFSVGALTCIGSVMTLVSKDRLKSDVPFNYTALLGWSLLELTLGVAAASLPVLGALLSIFPRSTGPVISDQRHSDFNTRPKPSIWSSSKHMWRELSGRKRPQEIKLRQVRNNTTQCDESAHSDYSSSLY